MLKVLQAGPLSTIQDLGRYGVAHLGVCRAGALDPNAATVANLLLGNPANHACVEVIGGSLLLECASDCWVCVTGQGYTLHATGDAAVDANIAEVTQAACVGWPLLLRVGARLAVKHGHASGTAYVAVAGGFELPCVMHSRSTDLGAGFGGLDGRALRAGDSLPIAAPNPRQQRRLAKHAGTASRFGVRQVPAPAVLRAVPGPEYERFDNARIGQFWARGWKLSTQSNRMGCRLNAISDTSRSGAAAIPAAAALATNAAVATDQAAASELASLASHAVIPGTVQWPQDGGPIVLLADAQTTGGYARIACVIQADLWRLAQLPRHSTIHFESCDLDSAVAELRRQRAQLNRFKLALARRFTE